MVIKGRCEDLEKDCRNESDPKKRKRKFCFVSTTFAKPPSLTFVLLLHDRITVNLDMFNEKKCYNSPSCPK